MVPVRDSIKSKTLPLVNYALIALNIFVFVYEISVSSAGLLHIDGPAALALFDTWGLVPARFSGPAALLTSPQILSSMFLHGGLAHVVSNLLYLFIFGDNVEDWLGHRRYLAFYLFCGLAAAFGQYSVDTTSAVPMIGASGAISGVLGAYMLLYPRARVVTLWWLFIFVRFIELPAVIYLGGWFAYQLVSGLVETRVGQGGVAIWAHVGGFVAGVVFVRLFGLFKARGRRS